MEDDAGVGGVVVGGDHDGTLGFGVAELADDVVGGAGRERGAAQAAAPGRELVGAPRGAERTDGGAEGSAGAQSGGGPRAAPARLLVWAAPEARPPATIAPVENYLNPAAATRRHCVLIEQPIEYLHRSQRWSMTQREVGSDTESFESGVRAAPIDAIARAVLCDHSCPSASGASV